VIGTYREVEARRSPRVAALLVRVARDGTARSLAELDHDVVSSWLAASLGRRASPELADVADRELRLQRDIADRLRLPWHQLRGTCIQLLWSSLRGDDDGVAAAEHIIRDHIERVDEVRGQIFLEANRRARAEARGDERTAADARTRLEGLLARDPFGSWCLPVLRAAALARSGRKDDARAVFLQFAPEGPAAALRAMGPALLLDVAPFVLDLGDAGWIQEVYDVLIPFEGRNSVNLVLLTSDGPIAYHLGLLARALGRADDAARHFAAALAMCERAGFTACAARTRAALGARPRLPDTSASAGPPELRRRGDVWILRHGGRELLLADSKGVCYLAALLEEPGRERHVLELVREGGGGDAGPTSTPPPRRAIGAGSMRSKTPSSAGTASARRAWGASARPSPPSSRAPSVSAAAIAAPARLRSARASTCSGACATSSTALPSSTPRWAGISTFT
jgi:hypothetical protein